MMVNSAQSSVGTAQTIAAPVLGRNGSTQRNSGILYGRPYGGEATFSAYDDALLHVLAEQKLASIPVITGWTLDPRIESLLADRSSGGN